MLATLRNRVYVVSVLLPCFFFGHVRAQENASVSSGAQGNRKDHHATLRWVPSPNAKTHKSAKYWIYRVDGRPGADGRPVCGSDYKKHAVVDISATSYVDHKVKASRIYCYYMITVTGDGKKDRSKPTPTVIAVIPPDEPEK